MQGVSFDGVTGKVSSTSSATLTNKQLTVYTVEGDAFKDAESGTFTG